MSPALIFDYDDTLVQTRQCKFAAIQALASRSYGLILSSGDIEQHWGKPYRQFFGDLFNLHGVLLDDVLQKYELLNDEFPMQLHADARRMIDDVLPAHYCAIVSAASRSRILAQLQSAGVPEYRFNVIQGAEQTEVHKPDPRVFAPALAAIKAHHTGPVEIIYIGDAYADYCAALGAGLRFIGISRTAQSRQQLKAAGAQVLDSLDELQATI